MSASSELRKCVEHEAGSADAAIGADSVFAQDEDDAKQRPHLTATAASEVTSASTLVQRLLDGARERLSNHHSPASADSASATRAAGPPGDKKDEDGTHPAVCPQYDCCRGL